ncbi:hypothetical protein HGRIS_006692 [Hohenbuehelia grisea]|uniref:Uncharacterized protein n=1 Tax=Hohenbuehelia grisea TaxID=104357 RepID=A0ABR3JAE3_9AGAR
MALRTDNNQKLDFHGHVGTVDQSTRNNTITVSPPPPSTPAAANFNFRPKREFAFTPAAKLKQAEKHNAHVLRALETVKPALAKDVIQRHHSRYMSNKQTIISLKHTCHGINVFRPSFRQAVSEVGEDVQQNLLEIEISSTTAREIQVLEFSDDESDAGPPTPRQADITMDPAPDSAPDSAASDNDFHGFEPCCACSATHGALHHCHPLDENHPDAPDAQMGHRCQ